MATQHAYPKLNKTILALSPLALIINGLFSATAVADDKIEVIEIHADHLKDASLLGSSEQLLTELGVDFSAAGGVSSLPILNGMMGDRVKVLVDGADITAACANQMNPPLSYLSANQIKSLTVIAGISPVSAGGDNIAGVIHVNAIAPTFSDSTSLTWQAGSLAAQYRSVDEGVSLGASAQLASKTFSLSYQGAYSDAKSYQDGNGETVLDTLYRSQNHVLIAALKSDKQQLAIKLNHQHIPFQGFANQYMDMVDNTSVGLTTQYQRQTELGDFSAHLNWHKVSHEMGFFTDEKTGKMPMKTDAEDASYQLKFAHEFNNTSAITLGQEYYHYEIEDWWPPVAGSMMMGPNEYHNIHDGKRQRLAAFAQLDQQLNTAWSMSGGIRIEQVRTQAGLVQNYNSMPMTMPGMPMPMKSIDAKAAEQFNQQDRKQSDTLVDATIVTRYAFDNFKELQFGLARKNRAPNLYERYSWGQSAMATSMIGWYGDGNGYIGDIHLAPETAHTASITYAMAGDTSPWQWSTNLWYSAVNDYIDADVVGRFNRSNIADNKRHILKFTNVDAHLYGVRFDGSVQLHDSKNQGQITLKAKVNATRGERDDSNDPLYQIQPLQSELKLIQQQDNWQHAISWQWVDSKHRVDARRLENQTDSYHLVNIQSSVTWQQLSMTFAITNFLDTQYELPLGGVNIAEFKADTSQGYQQLRGQGRSLNVSMNYTF